MRSLQDALDQFSYHPATSDTAPRHAAVRDGFAAFLEQLWPLVPDGPEKTLAVRKLQESQMYANLAIALTAPPDTSATRSVARVLSPEQTQGFEQSVDAVRNFDPASQAAAGEAYARARYGEPYPGPNPTGYGEAYGRDEIARGA